MSDTKEAELYQSVIMGFESLTQLAERAVLKSRMLIERGYRRRKKSTGDGFPAVVSLVKAHRVNEQGSEEDTGVFLINEIMGQGAQGKVEDGEELALEFTGPMSRIPSNGRRGGQGGR